MSEDGLSALEEAAAPTVGDAVRVLRSAFAASGEGARAEARTIVGHVLGLDLTGLVVGADRPIDPADVARVVALARRRLAGEPVQRLVGSAGFFGLEFGLSAETLVPRPDTEVLVETVLARLENVAAPVIADIGTGSGAILVALLHERADARGVGVDVSADALATAEANARANGVGERALFVRGSWVEALGAGQFDAIVSNPPYIATAVIAGLDEEVRAHDPMRALDGGADGLDAYRALAATVAKRLVSGGLVAFEIGWDQAAAVVALLCENGFDDVEVIADLAGRDRVVVGRRGNGRAGTETMA